MTDGRSRNDLKTSSRFVTDFLVIAIFCGFLFFLGLSYFGLVGADEPRYAQVAREMLDRHDWVTPTLGGQPWLEKPVLYYWQAMVAYRIFGVSDWAARLPSALDATLAVVAVYLFLRRFRSGFELDGALIAASSAGVIVFARAAGTDMPLAAMFAIAMLSWYAWYESQSRIYLALAFLFLGFGVLAKGPVAIFLAVLVLLLFAALTRNVKLIRQTMWAPGIAVLGAVVLPWYASVQIRNPQFFRVFILEHNFARFGTDLYHHRQPFWYFFAVAAVAAVPWITFVVVAIFQNIHKWARNKTVGEPHEHFGVFLLIWLIVPIVFFSMSRSKLPGYILPSVPAGSLLVAEYVRLHAKDSPRLWHIFIHAIVSSSLLVPALMIQYVLVWHWIPWARALVPLALAGVCTAAIALTLRVAGLGMLRFATLIPVTLAVAVVLRSGAPVADSILSARPLSNEIRRFAPHLQNQSETMPITVFNASRETEFGLAFYLDRPIARYGRDVIPRSEHLVIAKAGSKRAVEEAVRGRRISYLGSFRPQGLDYFWVAERK